MRAAPRLAVAADESLSDKADYTLRIGTGLVELSSEHIVSTTLYNGQFPGPLLKFKEGQRVVVDVYNDTDTPELVHWHGQMIPSDVDGAAEEGTPFVPAHGMRRVAFVPRPSGFRFYHTHVVAGGDLSRGTYTGQAGPVYIEPQHNPGAYDRRSLPRHEGVRTDIQPRRRHGDGRAARRAHPGLCNRRDAQRMRRPRTRPRGSRSATNYSPLTAACSGHGDPIRVKHGQRVLFHVLNASATEIRSLALPGHVFRVVALDGNPVPTPE